MFDVVRTERADAMARPTPKALPMARMQVVCVEFLILLSDLSAIDAREPLVVATVVSCVVFHTTQALLSPVYNHSNNHLHFASPA